MCIITKIQLAHYTIICAYTITIHLNRLQSIDKIMENESTEEVKIRGTSMVIEELKTHHHPIVSRTNVNL